MYRSKRLKRHGLWSGHSYWQPNVRELNTRDTFMCILFDHDWCMVCMWVCCVLGVKKPPIRQMFTDVYADIPPHLQQQVQGKQKQKSDRQREREREREREQW